MDINYFLLLKDKYTSMLSNINDIIEICKEINEYAKENILNNERELYILFNSDANMEIFLERKKQIKNLKKICNQYIYYLCNHEFVRDDIDIDPDKSNTIYYCRLCELNEEHFKSL